MRFQLATAGALLAAATLITHAAFAAAPDLPKTLALSAYDVGSGGYNQAVAIGSAFKNKYGVNLRIIPGKNDVSRLLPLKTGRLDFVANGMGSYMAQEGLFEFGAEAWGPQPLRLLLTNISSQGLTVIAAADTGVETIADLKGKRVAWVVGAPALNQNISALLRFANLTWDDVEKVEFGGYGASLSAIVNDQVDAGFSVTVSGKAYELEKSPRGLVWPTLPKSDTAGWERVKAHAPYFVPVHATEGAGLSKDHGVETSTYPYPILHTLVDRKADEVYAMMQAMIDAYPDYKDAAPGASGWALENQNLEWVIPYHEGAIRFFKEKGLWTDAHEKHNDSLIERQDVLAEAWKGITTQDAGPEEHMAAWQKARADALRASGFDIAVENW